MEAMQVYLNKSNVQAWYEGRKVIALKQLPSTANPDQYRHINVAGDEITANTDDTVFIEKHY